MIKINIQNKTMKVIGVQEEIFLQDRNGGRTKDIKEIITLRLGL